MLRHRIQLSGGWAIADIGPPHLVRVGDVLLPKRVEVSLGGGPEKWPSLEMVLEVIDGRPQCRELTVRSVAGGREVRDLDLTAARVEQWTEDVYALFGLVLDWQKDGETAWSFRLGSEDVVQPIVHAARRARKMTPDFLREVAAVYIEHRTGKPTAAIKERYGVSHRTAALWAKRASEAGFLPPASPGRRRR